MKEALRFICWWGFFNLLSYLVCALVMLLVCFIRWDISTFEWVFYDSDKVYLLIRCLLLITLLGTVGFKLTNNQ